ncbi:MAG: hypothetical protein NT062_35040 [Proteobacteria bacterium]|nr:hypothetical protein [Pseudomonadota bacterium]
MLGTRLVCVGMVAASLVGGCGGKKAKTPHKPKAKVVEPPTVKEETEADRAAKRLEAAHAIIPDGSKCLPPALKESGAPHLELGVVTDAAMVCAIDTDPTRLLGPVGCFRVNLGTNELSYEAPQPLPGIGFAVHVDDKCARGYCLPAAPAAKTAHIVWSPDTSKVAVLADETIHVFEAAAKAHTADFSIRGDKGVTGEPASLHWVGDVLFVENADGNVFAFKADGTAIGGLEVLGGKAGQLLSTKGGSFSVLDNKARIAIAEKGWSTLTSYEVDSGKRTKVVRKLAKAPCKPEELDGYFKDPTSLADGKCKDYATKTFAYLVGANGIAGSKNLLVVLRDGRLGELGVIDPKTLVEQPKIIKLSWCGASAAPSE